MDYEWDKEKAQSNFQKHGVHFADAVGVLEDERAVTLQDLAPHDEERWITLGLDALARVLVVVWTWRDESIRLISARRATPTERKQYEEGL